MFKINHVLASSLDSNLHHFSSASLLTASEMALFLAFLSHDIFSTWQPESSLTLFRSSAFLLKIPEWLFHSKSLQEATNDSTVCSLLIPWPPPPQLVSSSLLPLLTLFQHSCLLVIYGTGQIFCSCYFFFPGILFTVDTLMAHLLQVSAQTSLLSETFPNHCLQFPIFPPPILSLHSLCPVHFPYVRVYMLVIFLLSIYFLSPLLPLCLLKWKFVEDENLFCA